MPFLALIGSGIASFAKSIPWQAWAAAAGALVALFIVWQVTTWMNAQAKQIETLKGQVTQYQQANNDLNLKVATLAKTNNDNAAVYVQSVQQVKAAQAIAEQERDDANARAAKYRSIIDAAQAKPSTLPVDPVVTGTIGSLYDTPASATRH